MMEAMDILHKQEYMWLRLGNPCTDCAFAAYPEIEQSSHIPESPSLLRIEVDDSSSRNFSSTQLLHRIRHLRQRE